MLARAAPRVVPRPAARRASNGAFLRFSDTADRCNRRSAVFVAGKGFCYVTLLKCPHPKPLPRKEGGASRGHLPLPYLRRDILFIVLLETTLLPEAYEHLDISPALAHRMHEIARQLRKIPTPSEAILWNALRYKRLDGRKFRRQVSIGAFVVDFYCWAEKLVIEVDGEIHELQLEADAQRQALIESLGIQFLRFSSRQVDTDLPSVLKCIRVAFQNTSSE